MTDFRRLQEEAKELFELWQALGKRVEFVGNIFQNGFQNITEDNIGDFRIVMSRLRTDSEDAVLLSESMFSRLPSPEIQERFGRGYADAHTFDYPNNPTEDAVYAAGYELGLESFQEIYQKVKTSRGEI